MWGMIFDAIMAAIAALTRLGRPYRHRQRESDSNVIAIPKPLSDPAKTDVSKQVVLDLFRSYEDRLKQDIFETQELRKELGDMREELGALRRHNTFLRERNNQLVIENTKLIEENQRWRNRIVELEEQPSATVVCNDKGIITEWDAPAMTLFHYSAKEAIGLHITRLIPVHRRDEHNKAFRDALEMFRMPPNKQRDLIKCRIQEALTREGREISVRISLHTWLTGTGDRMFSAVMQRLYK